MKFSHLLAGAFQLAALVSAVPNNAGGNPEVVAAQKIKQLQKQYQQYIWQTIKGRTTGCTKNDILKRKEWYARLPTTSLP
jgi:hypothetical protein